jgi:hypothetical protein
MQLRDIAAHRKAERLVYMPGSRERLVNYGEKPGRIPV